MKRGMQGLTPWPRRTLAWMEAIAGQFYLAVVVAGLVNTMPLAHSRSNSTRTE